MRQMREKYYGGLEGNFESVAGVTAKATVSSGDDKGAEAWSKWSGSVHWGNEVICVFGTKPEINGLLCIVIIIIKGTVQASI